jgi:hypothetical protein
VKSLKHLIIVAFISLAATSISKGQDYGKVEYWGKTYNLDRSFFEYLNRNMDYFTKVTAPQWRWYDARDYGEIYVSIVNYMRNKDNVTIVTEANQLMFRSATDFMPGQVNEPKRSKKSKARAVWVLTEVVQPALKSFVDNYNPYPNKFQQ